MSQATYQTIKLGKGKHSSSEEGACVMELASMLADEPFSDHPASVCPVIGSLLRAYNDSIDSTRRQDLYAYASKVVGSRSPGAVQQARTDRLAAWTSEHRRSGSGNFLQRWLRWLTPPPYVETIGLRVVSAIDTSNRRTHQHVLALIDELLAMGPRRRASLAGAPQTGDSPEIVKLLGLSPQ